MTTILPLGRKPGVVHDRRTLQLAAVASLPPAPPTFQVAHTLNAFPVFANDAYGDCTCAAQGHRVVITERSSGQHEIALTDDDVLAAYSAVTGFKRDDPSTDNGAYCLDVLNYMRRTGMGRERDGSRHTIAAFAQVKLRDHDQVRRALHSFGGLYVGAGLPLSAQDEVGGTWARITDEPGSWGGHAMYVRGYARSGPIFVTWGKPQAATWKWWDRYVDEAYAIVSEDYLRASGRTPQGLDVAALKSYLAALG